MSLNIIEFVKKLLPVVKKDDVESDLEISIEALEDIQAIYSDLNSYIQKVGIKSKDVKKVIDEIYKELDKAKPSLKLSSRKSFAADFLTLLTNIKQNANVIQSELEKNISESTVTGALEAYKANLLSAVAHYRFMTKYAIDLANYIYTKDTSEEEVPKDSLLNSAQIKEVENNCWIFGKLITGYGQPQEVFTKKLQNIAQVNISKDDNDSLLEHYAHSGGVELIDGLPQGFIGSPIYTIRLVFAQWEADRYREIKDKKKLLELRHYYLSQLKENGQADISVEKEIEYLQKRITKLDYKLSKIEESIEG